MNGTPLERDRSLGELLGDAVGVLGRHLGVALLLAAAVVVPVELLVSGIGLGQLTASYDEDVTGGEALFSSLVSVLVITPLITGMLVRLVLDDAAGEPVSIAACVRTALDAFAPLLLVVAMTTVAIVVGLVALIVPGIFIGVRLAVAAPAVVIEGRRGTDALRRSWGLVAGNGWWVLGVLIVTGLLAGVVGTLVSLPFEGAARSADTQALSLVGAMIGQIIGLPFSAAASILLFLTLRHRREAPAAGGAGGGEGPREDPFGRPEAPGGWEPPVPPRQARGAAAPPPSPRALPVSPWRDRGPARSC